VGNHSIRLGDKPLPRLSRLLKKNHGEWGALFWAVSDTMSFSGVLAGTLPQLLVEQKAKKL